MRIIDNAGHVRELSDAEASAVLCALVPYQHAPDRIPTPAKRYFVVAPDGPEREVSEAEATELLRREDGTDGGYDARRSDALFVVLYPLHPNVQGERYRCALSRADAYSALAADIADAPTYRARIEQAIAWLSIQYAKRAELCTPAVEARLRRAEAWLKATYPEAP